MIEAEASVEAAPNICKSVSLHRTELAAHNSPREEREATTLGILHVCSTRESAGRRQKGIPIACTAILDESPTRCFEEARKRR